MWEVISDIPSVTSALGERAIRGAPGEAPGPPGKGSMTMKRLLGGLLALVLMINGCAHRLDLGGPQQIKDERSSGSNGGGGGGGY
jgi:hypothetical protein